MREKKKYGLQKPSANVNRSGCEHYHMQNKKLKKRGEKTLWCSNNVQ